MHSIQCIYPPFYDIELVGLKGQRHINSVAQVAHDAPQLLVAINVWIFYGHTEECHGGLDVWLGALVLEQQLSSAAVMKHVFTLSIQFLCDIVDSEKMIRCCGCTRFTVASWVGDCCEHVVDVSNHGESDLSNRQEKNSHAA
jgi:hypothetical protein